MSEQLDTIKCVDWTINFPGDVGGGADGNRAHLWSQAALQSLPSEAHLHSFGQVSLAAIHPSQESYRSITLQTGRESWPLLSLSSGYTPVSIWHICSCDLMYQGVCEGGTAEGCVGGNM